MSFGSGSDNQPVRPGEMLASEADREATQDVLKKAFEDERLTQDEFEARIGKAVAARTVGECAALTQDIPRPAAPVPAARPSRLIWLLGGGIAVVAVVVAVIATTLSGSGPARPAHAAPAGGSGGGGGGGGGNSGPAPTGAAKCPVGTSSTAQTIADALTSDPVYVDPGSTLVTPVQAGRLQAEIGQVDPGRIRVAVVTPATVRTGGGERALANAIANCQLTAAGATIVTTTGNTFIVTTYNSSPASAALGAALNDHASLVAGLKDGIKRLAIVDKDST
jgi:Domain of unknown function (DUF1707)